MDFRYAIRGLRRSPSFTITVVLTLALGIGANTTMFGVIDRLMFRPYAYMRDPSSVHRVYWQSWNRGTQRTLWDSEYTRYLDLERSTRSFSQLAAFTSRVVAIGAGDAARERTIMAVSASFFDFFDVHPAAGRFFTKDEDSTPRGADVAVLDHGFWKSELGGRDAIGEQIQIGNIRATIIGVAPEGFTGVNHDAQPAAYVPITTYGGHADGNTATNYFVRYNWRWVEIMVRRRAGVTLEQATADASQAAVSSWNVQRGFEPDLAPTDVAKPSAVLSALKLGAGPARAIEARTTLWIGGVALVVLLISCANVASLLLARSLGRERETAVRLALGVSRRRLATHVLAESLVLASLGGAIGVAVAYWTEPAVRALLATAGVGGMAVTAALTDSRTLLLATSLAVVVAIVTGLGPAVLAGRGDLTQSLRSGARGGAQRRSRARTWLLVAQGALSVMLLVGAALFVKSLDQASRLELGYTPHDVYVVTRRMRDVRLDEAGRIALRQKMEETARAIPGVAHATWAMTVPFSVTNSTSLFVPGIDSVARLGRFTYQAATADYFNTMGTRILRGRAFTSRDDARAPRVAIVGEGAARALWPGRDPIGQCVVVRVDTLPCSTVVGIAEDIVQDDVQATRRLQFYVPIDQFEAAGGSTLLVRAQRGAPVSRETLRQHLQRVLPGSAYVTVRPLTEIVDGAQRSWKLGATMFSAFGLLALVVAAVGLYGTVTYDVAQRRHEMSIRVALGAQTRDVVRLVVAHSLTFAAAGIVTGLVLAAFTARWMQPLLFRQSAIDPVVYAFVAVLIVSVALVASAAPALRATRADPNDALRGD